MIISEEQNKLHKIAETQRYQSKYWLTDCFDYIKMILILQSLQYRISKFNFKQP